MAELQGDKEAANACDYFRPATDLKPREKKGSGDFDSLFKDD
jgi:hypothetical protein